jgi:predicted enzyme related to lactoylglutathione lyase
MPEQQSRGRFTWHDLVTNDAPAAEAFYTKVVGWGTQVWEQAAYTMWTANGQPIGGLMAEPAASVPPHWLAYITVPDVDASVKQVESRGGRILTPAKDIPTVGRWAVVADPDGAVFSPFTPSTPAADDEPPKVGEFAWHELASRDYRKAASFYEELFGWEKSAEHDMGPAGVYYIFKRNGRDLGGMFTISPQMPMPASWLHYIRVDSADEAAERVKAQGGKVVNGPMDVPGGERIAQCVDQQGAAFAVHSK